MAIITGGGAGIGLTYARELASEGAAVVLADLDADAARDAAAAIVAEGGRALPFTADVADEEQVALLVRASEEAFGGVDILINNAAKHLRAYAQPCTALSREHWRGMLDLNVTAALICADHCRPLMEARGGGVIINQSSIAADMPTAGAYGVSKAALNALTAALAAELAPAGIRVNGISPCGVDSEAAMSEMTPERLDLRIASQLIPRQGRMTDLASAMLFLCSEESSFITGQTLVVDGGSLCMPRGPRR